MNQSLSLSVAAELVADRLRASGSRLVLAESCTGGLVAATLAAIPGISEHFCGSAVVYRSATKTAWLGIDLATLDDPQRGPVSAEITRALALAVLERTPEADLAAAVTGHLGPNAPPQLDGRVFIAVAVRGAVASIAAESAHVLECRDANPVRERRSRQQAAAQLVLEAVEGGLTRSR